MYVTGTKAALLSSLRNMPLGTSRPVYERVAAKRLPLQIFWGEQDQVIPYAVGQAMHAALPDVPFTTVPAAGHILHWEKPEAIRAKLLNFLKDH